MYQLGTKDSEISELPYLVYFFVEHPPANTPKKEISSAQRICKELITETFNNDRMMVQRLSREFIMYERKVDRDENAPRIILCYPDGRIYKSYHKKIGDGTLAKDMSELIRRVNKEAVKRDKARELAIKDWLKLQHDRLTLDEKIKKEEKDIQDQGKKKATGTLTRLKEQSNALNEKLDAVRKIATE